MKWVSRAALSEGRRTTDPKRLHEWLVPDLPEQIVGRWIEGNRVGSQQAGCPFSPHLAGIEDPTRFSPSLIYGIEDGRFAVRVENIFRSFVMAHFKYPNTVWCEQPISWAASSCVSRSQNTRMMAWRWRDGSRSTACETPSCARSGGPHRWRSSASLNGAWTSANFHSRRADLRTAFSISLWAVAPCATARSACPRTSSS